MTFFPFQTSMQAVTNLLNNESVSDIDRLLLVMLYALRYEKESPVQLMQLFNKLASRSAKYKPGLLDDSLVLKNWPSWYDRLSSSSRSKQGLISELGIFLEIEIF
ncbi:hypothetical protein CMV_028043 [Castanea mollissima]|uniref:Uncharacterized protein n=1 Tax=Castanea mollissima TaxID=60419 RepID=A0A8J4V5F6_9ROSI|nr:hypothetical protein CMV_028043 [Castanea mollissima]